MSEEQAEYKSRQRQEVVASNQQQEAGGSRQSAASSQKPEASRQANHQQRLKAQIPFATGNKTELLATRDALLVARYYYYFHLKRMREDDVFNLLSKQEFFITPDTIYRRVVEQNNTLNELIKTSASAPRLARMYPTWKW